MTGEDNSDPVLPKTPAQVYETLNDGAEANLVFKDGRTEVVKIWKIARKRLPFYADIVQRGETFEAEFYCDKPEDWSETLTDESYEVVLEEGRRLNFHLLGPFVKRRMAFIATQKDMPKEMKDVMERAMSTVLREHTKHLSPAATATPPSGPTPPTS